MMTVYEIFLSALTLMAEEDGEDYKAFVVSLMNLIIAESFEVNNGIRVWHKKEPLTDIPAIKALEDICPYEAELTKMVLPFGLAGRLLFDENDLQKGNYFLGQYRQALSDTAKCECIKIKDYYGVGA